MQDIEIICVNDGSKDNSVAILEEYAGRDNRIIILHKKNGGLSSARNEGMKYARAEYIAFVDSDDWVESDTYERAYNAMRDSEADLVCFYANVDGEDYEPEEHLVKYHGIKRSGLFSVDNEIIIDTSVTAWNKLYKKAIISEYNLSFPDGLIHEDVEFFNIYAALCKTVFYIDAYLYHYVLRAHSITWNEKGNRKKKSIDLILICYNVYSFYNSHGLLDKYSSALYQLWKNELWNIYYRNDIDFRLDILCYLTKTVKKMKLYPLFDDDKILDNLYHKKYSLIPLFNIEKSVSYGPFISVICKTEDDKIFILSNFLGIPYTFDITFAKPIARFLRKWKRRFENYNPIALLRQFSRMKDSIIELEGHLNAVYQIASSNREGLNRVTEELSRTRDALAGTQDRLEQTQGQLAETRQQVDGAHDRITQVNDWLNETNKWVENTNNRIDDTNKRVDGNQERLSDVQNQVTETREQVAVVKQQVDGNQKRLFNVQDQVNETRQRVDGNQEWLDRVQNEVNEAKQQVDGHNGWLSGVQAQVDAAKKQVESDHWWINAVEQQFKKHEIINNQFITDYVAKKKAEILAELSGNKIEENAEKDEEKKEEKYEAFKYNQTVADTLAGIEEFYFIPNNGNIGDAVIAGAEYQFLSHLGCSYRTFDMYAEKLPEHKNIRLVYGGGGLFVKYYDYHIVTDILKSPNLERIIILPSSFFECDELLSIFDERFTVFCREKRSYDYCIEYKKKNKTGAKFILSDDMAFNLDLKLLKSRESENIVGNVLNMPEEFLGKLYEDYGLCMHIRANAARAFAEKTVALEDGRRLGYLLRSDVEAVSAVDEEIRGKCVDLSALTWTSCADAGVVKVLTALFADAINTLDIVITDRLHVGITGAMLGKRVYLLDNSYGKLSGVYEQTLSSLAHVSLIRGLEEARLDECGPVRADLSLFESGGAFDDFFAAYFSAGNLNPVVCNSIFSWGS